MSKSLKVQSLVDWFLIHMDEWSEPVMVKDLAAVDSGWSRPDFLDAIKRLHDLNLIYKYSEDSHGLIRWLPTSRRPVCAVQDLICGRRIG